MAFTYQSISRVHDFGSLGGVGSSVARSGMPSTLAPPLLRLTVSGVDAAVVGCRTLSGTPDRYFGFRDLAVDGNYLVAPSETFFDSESTAGPGSVHSAMYRYHRLINLGTTVLVREEFDVCGGSVIDTWTYTSFHILVRIQAFEEARGFADTKAGFLTRAHIHFRDAETWYPEDNAREDENGPVAVPADPHAFRYFSDSQIDWFDSTVSNQVTAAASNDADHEASNGGTIQIRPATAA